MTARSGLSFALALVVPFAAVAIMAAQRPAARPVIDIVKDPGCGCCELWAKHLEQQGFATRMTESDDMAAVKIKRGVPATTRSCHTAVVEGYVLEGHVPASDIQRLLVERPKIAGLAVPGMPIGSPGMEVSGMKAQPFDVMAFTASGTTRIYSSHNR